MRRKGRAPGGLARHRAAVADSLRKPASRPGPLPRVRALAPHRAPDNTVRDR